MIRPVVEGLSGPAEITGGKPVALVVVNFDSHELLETNFSGLGDDLAVVVVDNYHSVRERTAVRRSCAQFGWLLLTRETNVGFGSAVNAGVAFAAARGAKVVVLVNPDALITRSVIDELVAECLRHPTAMVSPRIVRPDGSTWFEGGRILFAQGRTVTADLAATSWPDGWLTGACMAVSVDFWNDVGGFDDDYFMYWEDVDLSHRWRLAGGRLLVRGDLTVAHLIGGTQSTSAQGRSAQGRSAQGRFAQGRSALYYRFNCRNRLLFAAKHLDAAQLRVWLRTTPSYARSIFRRGGGRRQLLRHPFMPVWSTFRGSVEGYRLARKRLRLIAGR